VREPTHRGGHSLDLALSNNVLATDLHVYPMSPSDDYYVSFHIKDMDLPTRPTDVVWRRDTKFVNRCNLFFSLCKAGLVYTGACTSNQPDEFSTLNTGLQKAVDAVAPSRSQRLKARDYPFLLSKKLEKMRRSSVK